MSNFYQNKLRRRVEQGACGNQTEKGGGFLNLDFQEKQSEARFGQKKENQRREAFETLGRLLSKRGGEVWQGGAEEPRAGLADRGGRSSHFLHNGGTTAGRESLATRTQRKGND